MVDVDEIIVESIHGGRIRYGKLRSNQERSFVYPRKMGREILTLSTVASYVGPILTVATRLIKYNACDPPQVQLIYQRKKFLNFFSTGVVNYGILQ